MDDLTERMLASSTIDNPVETRQLLVEMNANLPIPVRISEIGLHGLRKEGTYMKDIDAIHQVHGLTYSGDMGGILCCLTVEQEKEDGNGMETHGLVMSMTHLKVDPTHPVAAKIKEYQKKRALGVAIANIGTRRAAAKPKRKKRGFGG